MVIGSLWAVMPASIQTRHRRVSPKKPGVAVRLPWKASGAGTHHPIARETVLALFESNTGVTRQNAYLTFLLWQIRIGITEGRNVATERIEWREAGRSARLFRLDRGRGGPPHARYLSGALIELTRWVGSTWAARLLFASGIHPWGALPNAKEALRVTAKQLWALDRRYARGQTGAASVIGATMLDDTDHASEVKRRNETSRAKKLSKWERTQQEPAINRLKILLEVSRCLYERRERGVL